MDVNERIEVFYENSKEKSGGRVGGGVRVDVNQESEAIVKIEKQIGWGGGWVGGGVGLGVRWM